MEYVIDRSVVIPQRPEILTNQAYARYSVSIDRVVALKDEQGFKLILECTFNNGDGTFTGCNVFFDKKYEFVKISSFGGTTLNEISQIPCGPIFKHFGFYDPMIIANIPSVVSALAFGHLGDHLDIPPLPIVGNLDVEPIDYDWDI